MEHLRLLGGFHTSLCVYESTGETLLCTTEYIPVHITLIGVFWALSERYEILLGGNSIAAFCSRLYLPVSEFLGMCYVKMYLKSECLICSYS